MNILGIDPGASGALVILQNNTPIEWMLMPTITVGAANRVNGAEVARFIDWIGCEHAFIEKVGAMPGQGVASMFNFGHNVGTVMGVLQTLNISHTLVTPQSWKKRAGLIGKDKDAARSRATQLWPTWDVLSKKGTGQALADAALIARFGL